MSLTVEQLPQLKVDLLEIQGLTSTLSDANKVLVEDIREQVVELAEDGSELPGEILELCDNLLEKDFSTEQRDALAKKGHALPDGSYPIENTEDLKNAIQAIGRASNPDAAKAHIKKRARELGATDLLPDSWKESENKDKDKSGKLVESVRLLEQTDAEKKGREWEVMLIQEGLSKNKYSYSSDVLKRATRLFEGVTSYADHTEGDDRPKYGRSVKDKVGKFADVQYGSASVDGKLVEGVKATFKVIAPWLQQTLLESYEQGEPDFLGLSIDADGKWEPKVVGGQRIREVKDITRVHSVDVVTDPSAGGRLMRLVASTTTDDGDDDMSESITKEEIAALVAEALKEVSAPTVKLEEELASIKEAARRSSQLALVNTSIQSASQSLSDLGQQRIRESFKDAIERRDVTEEEITARITEQAEYEAALYQRMMPKPSASARVYLGDDTRTKMYKALEGLLDGNEIDGIPPFNSLKEAYCRWTNKDYFDVDPFEMFRDMTDLTYDSQVDHRRIQESLATAQWNQVYADVLYLQMMKSYRATNVYNQWTAIVSEIENVPDFQTRHWTRIGGYGDLATVPETQTYPMLVTPTDEEVTYSVNKRGGLDDVTFESIVNDRIGAVRRLPVAMGRAAARTLFKFVLNMVTTDNPVMAYDSVALYNSAHANLAASNSANLLSITALQAVVTAMRSQTAYSETLEILGARNKPKILIVPTNLEYVAARIINPSDAFLAALTAPGASGELDPQAFKGAGMSVIVYDQLVGTDVNDWYAVADPGEVETAIVGFLNGRRDPEMFVQDQPTVGSNMTADKQTYKVRHIYGGVVGDHRSFYKSIVP